MSRHASHVPASPIAYDTARGSAVTPRLVTPKIAPLLSPWSVHRRGTTSRRSAGIGGADGANGSEAFEESIVHRQKTGTCGVGHGTQLTPLAAVHRGNRHAGDPPA